MTAFEARKISILNSKKPAEVEELLKKIFLKIEDAASKGEFAIVFIDKNISDQTSTFTNSFLQKMGYTVQTMISGFNILWY